MRLDVFSSRSFTPSRLSWLSELWCCLFYNSRQPLGTSFQLPQFHSLVIQLTSIALVHVVMWIRVQPLLCEVVSSCCPAWPSLIYAIHTHCAFLIFSLNLYCYGFKMVPENAKLIGRSGDLHIDGRTPNILEYKGIPIFPIRNQKLCLFV
jgi:hypothetical protein